MIDKIAQPPIHEQVRLALEDTKGVDIRVLDVRQITAITDYMVIASGTSDRHVRSLANNVLDAMSKSGVKSIGIEGEREAQWILVDLQDVVVHVMQKSARNFYQLERLWDARNETTSTDAVGTREHV